MEVHIMRNVKEVQNLKMWSRCRKSTHWHIDLVPEIIKNHELLKKGWKKMGRFAFICSLLIYKYWRSNVTHEKRVNIEICFFLAWTVLYATHTKLYKYSGWLQKCTADGFFCGEVYTISLRPNKIWILLKITWIYIVKYIVKSSKLVFNHKVQGWS